MPGMRTSIALLLVLGSSCKRSETCLGLHAPKDKEDRVGHAPLEFIGDKPTNVLFLSIDTLRKDHVGAHGAEGLTPFLDCLAENSVVLDDHMQCSNWTFGSTTCTVAGRSNIERGHIPRLVGGKENRPKVPQDTPFLATWLGGHGYFSLVVTGNSWFSEEWRNTQGYTEEHKPHGNATAVGSKGIKNLKSAIRRGDADRWFMHLHFMEPHAGYDPPNSYLDELDTLEDWPEDLGNRDTHYEWRSEYPNLPDGDRELLEAHLRVRYGGEVAVLDERLAEVWADLDKNGMLDDTLVVVWSDHGEQFWEHGAQTHAFTLHGEETDGIAFVWARNIVPGRWAEPTSAIDIAPTVLDILDLPIPDEVTGIPVGLAPPDRPRYAEAIARRGAVQAVSKDGYKLQYRWSGGLEFYDRQADPLEQENLYNPTDPKVLELWSLLKPQVQRMAPLVVDGNPKPQWPPALP